MTATRASRVATARLANVGRSELVTRIGMGIVVVLEAVVVVVSLGGAIRERNKARRR